MCVWLCGCVHELNICQYLLNIKVAKWTRSESLIISITDKLVNLHSNCAFKSHDNKYQTPAPTQIRFSIFSIEPVIDMAAPFVAWPQTESHAAKQKKSYIFITGYWIVSFRHLFPRRRTLPAWLLTSTILITGRMVAWRWLMSYAYQSNLSILDRTLVSINEALGLFCMAWQQQHRPNNAKIV